VNLVKLNRLMHVLMARSMLKVHNMGSKKTDMRTVYFKLIVWTEWTRQLCRPDLKHTVRNGIYSNLFECVRTVN
jgi:hypothetical protein